MLMNNKKIKIAFFGTPSFAWNILAWTFKHFEIDIVLVVSQPDKVVGRKRELQVTPVKQVAFDAGIEVLQPERLKTDTVFLSKLESLKLDFIVVVAYGKIIPKSILDIPKYGCVNIHGSILPKYRGASPVQAAVKSGDSETGITIMFMSEWMDEGDILQIEKVSIDEDDTSPDIFKKFTDIWPKLLIYTLQKVQSWDILGTPQNDSLATYCGKISREEGEVFFQKQSAQEIYNTYKAYTPWPGIFTYFHWKRFVIEDCCFSDVWDFERDYEWELVIWKFIKINKKHYAIICNDKKFLVLKNVKLEGKKSMDIVSFVNGNREVLEYIFQ